MMNIGIVGLGLIGGSLGLDLRSEGHRIFGVSQRAETCELAIARGAVDVASQDLALLVDAELVFICTPIAAIQATVKQLIPHLTPQAVLTDVGSVKAAVVEAITPLWQNFVGGHPMAGTAESGIQAAQTQLFAGKPYVLTPTPTTPTAAVKLIEEILSPLKVRLFHCQPDAHDRAVAWISHLPVIASASLIAACLSEPDSQVAQLAKALASSGFRDTSRVGGGNPELGLMMAQYNRSALLRSLQVYRQTLDQLMAQIEQENWTALTEQLQQTRQARPDFVDG